MSEYMTEVGPSQGGALSSFSMMTGQGEGIYASPTSVDVGLQQRDEVGLTHFTKTQPECKLPLDACKITDQDFQDALQQLEPLLAEQEQMPPPFHAESIYSTHRRYVAASNKRRKLHGDLNKPLPQKPLSAPVIWPESPVIDLASSEPVMFHYETQNHGDASLHQNTLEPYFPAAVGSADGIQEMQKNVESASLTTREKTESVEAINTRSGASEISQKTPVNCRGIVALASDCSDLEKNLKGLDKLFHHDPYPEICNGGFESTKLAGVTNVYQCKGLCDPDLPLTSVEKENENLSVSCHTNNHKSRSLGIAECAIYGVPKGLSSSPYQTIAGVDNGSAQEGANETTRKLVLSQNSLGPSRKLSQTSALVPIAKLFLQNSLKASSEGYSKALSSHQIPAELRQYFQALLRKFQTDEQFQKAVITYAMEQTGAMPPKKGPIGLMPLKLRQGLDAVRNRVDTDEKFKISVEKFTTEYLRDIKDSEDLGILECDLDELPEKIKPMPNLEELPREALIKYCRKLENRWSKWALKTRKERDARRALDRADRDRPRAPNPRPGLWTCFHPQTTRTSGKKTDDCGCKTPFYSKDFVWIGNTHCHQCNAPYDETLVSHHKKRGSKSQASRIRSASPAIPAIPRPLITGQPTAQANAQACIQDYYAASSPPDRSSVTQLNGFGISSTVREALLSDASTAHMYGALSENDHPDLRFRSPGWHSDNDSVSQAPISDQFHPNLMGGSPWNTHGGTVAYLPRQMSSSQTPSIGYTDALQIDMNFTGRDGEFDEFVLQMDPDSHMDIDSLFEEVGRDLDVREAQRLPEQSNLPQIGVQTSLPNSIQHLTHHPVQVNLCPPHTDLNSQNQVLPSSQSISAVDRNLVGGPRYASTSSSDHYYRNNGNLAPPRFEQMDNNFQLFPSRQFPSSGIVGSDGTQHSLQWSPSTGSPTSHSDIASLTNIYARPKDIASQSIAQPHIQSSSSSFGSNQTVSQIRPDIMITDTDSRHTLNENSDAPPEFVVPRSSYMGRRRGRSPKVKEIGPGRGVKTTTQDDSSSKEKRASPMKARAPQQRKNLSRPKPTPAKEATQSSIIKTRAPAKSLSQSRLAEVQASNSTSAMFLGGTRKSWEERTPQGAAADQDELDKALNAEFDRLERQQRLEVDERCEDGETGGDDESRHSDRTIAVAAAPAVAEESEESEEE